MPINLGNVVNDTKKPPKLDATTRTTNPNKRPPGAAVFPTITYNVNHAIAPANKERNEKKYKIRGRRMCKKKIN